MTLPLTKSEASTLRKHNIKQADLASVEPADLAAMLDVPLQRAKQLHGLAAFQQLNSIGHKFAQDLVAMGYTSLQSLADKTGADLLDEHERTVGYQTDPCVEDQCRLVVYVAQTGDNSRSWFDFTKERKAFRAQHGYP